MSVVIVGGNECMERRYVDLCEQHQCRAKVYTKIKGMKNIGMPDLLILFTSTMSHKMVRGALSEIKGSSTTVARCHTSSISALKNILNEHAPLEG